MKNKKAVAVRNYRVVFWGTFLMLVGLFQVSAVLSAPAKEVTVEAAYPGLATGILKNAKLAKLNRGVLLIAEGVKIDESMLKKVIMGAKPELHTQLKKNRFFILEQQATIKILHNEALKSGHKKNSPEGEIITRYLSQKVSNVTVSDEELRHFYDQNKESMGGMLFNQAKEVIKNYIIEQKKQDLITTYIQTIGKQINIQIDTEWVKEQSALAVDNKVDRARDSGKPTMVEFGATGCKPCDMMQPILDYLKKKYQKKLNVVFVHVGEEQILAARFGVRSIPVQVFFDRTGREFFRHVGFYPKADVEKKIAAMGVK